MRGYWILPKTDTVIMDLTMRGGMAGDAAIKELIAIDPRVQAVILSGYCEDPILANHKSYGFQAALHKPIKLDELHAVLQRFSRSHRC